MKNYVQFNSVNDLKIIFPPKKDMKVYHKSIDEDLKILDKKNDIRNEIIFL